MIFYTLEYFGEIAFQRLYFTLLYGCVKTRSLNYEHIDRFNDCQR